MRKTFLLGGAVGVMALSACGELLNVKNNNNPDVARAYATVDGVEGVIAGLGAGLYNLNGQRGNEGVNTQSKVLSGESMTSVNNFGGAPRSAIPRAPISNSLGNDIQVGNRAQFQNFSVLSRTASNAIAAVERLATPPGVGLGSVSRTQRARAFGYFVLGQVLGNLAAAYDSAAIVTPATPSAEIPGLSGYADVNVAAVAMMDSALAAIAASGGFTLPDTWLSSPGWSSAEFTKLVRSVRARVRVGAVRNATEAAAINWTAQRDDGLAGLTADFIQNVGGTTGWTGGYHTVQSYVASTWAWAPMYYYGMADVSGRYDAWLAAPRPTRAQFLVETPDTRWPQGATRAAQQAEAPQITGTLLPAGRYMRNRPTGEDPPADGWGQSMYDHRRWGFIRENVNTGALVEMDRSEPALYAAEAYMMLGDYVSAAPLIDISREAHGLPALAGVVANGTDPVPGGTDCVPRVPTGPNYTSTACGNMFEAMKYEYRMETAWTGFMAWFRAHRRWNDMIEGTPLEWPVPYQEMQARQKPFYDGSMLAGVSTYRFGNGADR
ncbi:MAG: hypothetical protein KF689_10865 [Gemmatimonadaceae bacterium]|nr:hypothetical protein [Gemmatimonadaceae bacterium]MCW5825899.1 hypothetical protein [Gemmatimonadaceae bacterium]